MYSGLKHAHSGFRWLILILLIIAIVNAYTKWKNRSDFTPKDKKIGLFTMIFCHIQLLIGIALYFLSPLVSFEDGFMKEKVARFFTIEHGTMMILALIIITMGYAKAKRKTDASQKFKTTFIYYLIGLIVIIAAIPWPFRALGAGWF